jgi:hypothetical protein
VGGEVGLHAASILDLDVVLSAHPMVQVALGSMALARIVFWIALTADAKVRTMYNTHSGG